MSDKSYPQEKVEELPAPVTAPARRQGPGFFLTLLRFAVVFFGTLFILDLFSEQPSSTRAVKGCMGSMRKHGYGKLGHGKHGKHGGHHIPNVDDWVKFEGTTHFELEPVDATGLTVKGGKSFGKVVFETSKLSDKVIIDLDIRTNKADKDEQISVTSDNGYITVDTPDTGKLKTFASAKIQIPSNIIGTFGLPAFEVDVPRHMVDLSGLPESLEIGELIVRVAKGFVKTGPVHTNNTQITVANGAVRGDLTNARESTNIDVANGNVTVDITKISSGTEGSSTVHLGNGDLKGTFSVWNATTLDVAKGSIYATVDFEESETRAELSTKIASGDARVYVNSIKGDRNFDAYHTSISGSQLITYPSNFEGTVDARGLVGDIKLAGKDLTVEKAIGGSVGKQGDVDRNYVSVKAARGSLDILVGDEQNDE